MLKTITCIMCPEKKKSRDIYIYIRQNMFQNKNCNKKVGLALYYIWLIMHEDELNSLINCTKLLLYIYKYYVYKMRKLP